MRNFSHSLSVLGTINTIDTANNCFTLTTRGGDAYTCYQGAETNFQVLQNADKVNQDTHQDVTTSNSNMDKYLEVGDLISCFGIYQENNGTQRYDVRKVYVLKGEKGDANYLYEKSDWWTNQVASFADTWLKNLFGNTEDYDFSNYQTHIDITGRIIEDKPIQECATLGRLLYGLSSAYMLTGCERYYKAAKAGVQYQRDNFRTISSDGECIIWAFGKNRITKEQILPSQDGDDANTIPLYEQIYDLAGLAQYYRITNDQETLHDIERTVAAFNRYYKDDSSEQGYFSHIDPATKDWNTERLGINKAKKNWNSIGDHIPAFLVNIILALEPIPQTGNTEKYQKTLNTLKELLDVTSQLIVDKFPDVGNVYVNERFYRDWQPDHTYSWQQNRAIIGHNLKIAWNLTRVANYYYNDNRQKADDCMTVAEKLGRDMANVGVDLTRGGIFDCVERDPQNGMPVDFVWGNTKDFWQQEQAVLAYQILFGYTGDDDYLGHARDMSAYWNINYLDHNYGAYYFRVRDDGSPIIEGNYGDKGGHAISGYHAFELCYLAHIYTTTYISNKKLCLHFNPEANTDVRSINVLPDFAKPGTYKVNRVTVNGVEKEIADDTNYQVELTEEELGTPVVVELKPQVNHPATRQKVSTAKQYETYPN